MSVCKRFLFYFFVCLYYHYNLYNICKVSITSMYVYSRSMIEEKNILFSFHLILKLNSHFFLNCFEKVLVFFSITNTLKKDFLLFQNFANFYL